MHNHGGPRCPWCVASAGSKLLDVVSQKSCPLAIVCVHQLQHWRIARPQNCVRHRCSAAAFAVSAGVVFGLHLPAHGLFLAAIPGVLTAAVVALEAFRAREPQQPHGSQDPPSPGSQITPLMACMLPVAVYTAVELGWLLFFFLMDPSYPWFLFYTRDVPFAHDESSAHHGHA